MVELGNLGLLDGHVGIGEIRAGVLHCLGVEPQFVKFVAEVVVVLDVGARVGQRVGTRPVEHLVLQLFDQLQMAGVVEPAVGGFEELNQIAFDVDALDTVEIAEVKHRIGEHPVQRSAVTHHGTRHRPAGAGTHFLAAPEYDRQPRVTHRRQKLARQPAIRRQHAARFAHQAWRISAIGHERDAKRVTLVFLVSLSSAPMACPSFGMVKS